ncbi:YkgJ family cysteine cluster protein [Gluconacetobacter takamatsuzukensis]|uniref:YkgJ family cysteine cluster protein n=1 Tax=Gluconacetobacter takamatsuzukensis TaxID=1286190 RepID=A0A7W4PNT9_9PROT|nr:YkgJ family cysteine cluster protein [Gluconacetobacter takamatsuzukensis]MBB2204967.1 YkgJ family cysteine cluster protein [Gluconacetobacter takamatsuzukensis]
MTHDEPAPSDASPLAYMRQKMGQADAAFRRDLQAATGTADLVRLARSILALCDEVAEALKRLSPAAPLACRKGCDTCCRNLVQVNPPFAILAVHEARQTFPPERLQALKDRVQAGVPFCPFLFDGSCTIYAARPMVCRGYYSLDVDLCRQGEYCEKERGYQGDQAHDAHQLMIFLFALEKRLESIETELGLRSDPVFLNDAAGTLLTDADAPAHWLAGSPLLETPPSPPEA